MIGYSSGHVDVFNMESSLYRGSYGKPLGECVYCVRLKFSHVTSCFRVWAVVEKNAKRCGFFTLATKVHTGSRKS